MEQRIADFRSRSLGLFVHYGAYVQYQNGEWALELCHHNPAEYEKKALQRDYSSFNVDNIIHAAKACGAHYITFTTRHHDGFSLYDTKGLSDYDIMHTPNGRDIVKEFVDACHKNDILPFLYHTTLDWHHPDFKNNFSKYQQYLRDSLEVLCKNYGTIGGFWLDGNWSKATDEWELDELYGVIRKYQPQAIIINNTGLEAQGVFGHPEIDCVTFEQGTPTMLDCSKMEKEYIGEMCYPLCEHWGIAQDINIKSMRQILEAYTACRRVGGNLLLGIFTQLDGSQPLLHQGYLEAMGYWVKRNQAALYGPVPTKAVGFGKDFILSQGSKRYVFVHDVSTWGDSNVLKNHSRGYSCFENVFEILKNGHWLDNGQAVESMQDVSTGMLCIKPAPFQYGESWVIRVAEFETEE